MLICNHWYDLCDALCQGVDKLPVALDACFAFLQRALQSLELLQQCGVAPRGAKP